MTREPARNDDGTRPRKTVVVTQTNYIPWRGWFDMIGRADEVVWLDSVQFTKRDWRNRNRIKTANGPLWLTIPVEAKGRYLQPIDETRVSDKGWAAEHLRSIELAYKRAAAFETTAEWLFPAMREAGAHDLLSDVNVALLDVLFAQLGTAAPRRRCVDLLSREDMRAMDPTQRLLALCEAVGATHYLSGPAAKSYMDVSVFEARGIAVEWMDYSGYAPYPQLWGAFEPAVSVVDLLLNMGPRSGAFLRRAAAGEAA